MINKLNIISGYKEGRSFLKDAFFTRPFRLANIGEDKSDPALYLMLMSSSPGILDGDNYNMNITVEEQSRLMMESQSYQRLFNMQTGAEQKMVINMEKNSVFSYVQHPIVPHEHSIFKAHNVVHVQDNCDFTMGEIITCGRKHSGEVFRFSRFQNLTEIFYNNKLIVKDNVLMQPQLVEMQTLGQTEGFTHQATLIHINTGKADLEKIINTTHDYLQLETDIIFGVSHPFASCMIVRILGNGGEQLLSTFRNIQQYLWRLSKCNDQSKNQHLFGVTQTCEHLPSLIENA
jgi:urease accessory protein